VRRLLAICVLGCIGCSDQSQQSTTDAQTDQQGFGLVVSDGETLQASYGLGDGVFVEYTYKASDEHRGQQCMSCAAENLKTCEPLTKECLASQCEKECDATNLSLVDQSR
jgi:hypothetical protein